MFLKQPEDWLVTEIATGKQGVASITQDDRVAVFMGNPDGSDDKIISDEAFNAQFTVTEQKYNKRD